MMRRSSETRHPTPAPLALLLLAMALAGGAAQAAKPAEEAKSAPAVTSRTEMGSPMSLVVNKSAILRLEAPAVRISVGNPAVADITPVSSREIILLGKSIGTTNLIVWDKSGVATVRDIIVTPEPPPPPAPPAPDVRDSVEVIKGLNKSTMEF
jgi:pilus assembly protein CpaC